MEKEYYRQFCRPQQEVNIEYKEYCLNERTWKDGALEKVSWMKEMYELITITKEELKNGAYVEYSYHIINCRGKVRDEAINTMSGFGWEYIGRCGKSCYFRRIKTSLESEEELTYVRNIREKNLTKVLATRMVLLVLALLAACFLVCAKYLAIRFGIIPENKSLLYFVFEATIPGIMLCVIIMLMNINKFMLSIKIYKGLNQTEVKYSNYQPRNILLWNAFVLIIIFLLVRNRFCFNGEEHKNITRISDDVCYRIEGTAGKKIGVEFFNNIYDVTKNRMINMEDEKYTIRLYVECIDDEIGNIVEYDYCDMDVKDHDTVHANVRINTRMNGNYTTYVYIMLYDEQKNRVKFRTYADAEIAFDYNDEEMPYKDNICLGNYREEWIHEF